MGREPEHSRPQVSGPGTVWYCSPPRLWARILPLRAILSTANRRDQHQRRVSLKNSLEMQHEKLVSWGLPERRSIVLRDLSASCTRSYEIISRMRCRACLFRDELARLLHQLARESAAAARLLFAVLGSVDPLLMLAFNGSQPPRPPTMRATSASFMGRPEPCPPAMMVNNSYIFFEALHQACPRRSIKGSEVDVHCTKRGPVGFYVRISISRHATDICPPNYASQTHRSRAS
jgi:hypothetical protein